MKQETKQNRTDNQLTYVSYYDWSYDYTGKGVLTHTTEDSFYVTSFIGALLVFEQTDIPLSDLPGYMMLHAYSEYKECDAIPLAEWVKSFSVEGMTAEEIFRVGSLFEGFFGATGNVAVRLELAIQRSLLTGKGLSRVVAHILNHYREQKDESLLACAVSPIIQSALHHTQERM